MKPAILVIDKPKGITSHMVISKLRYLLGERQIGHCGTLDPMASGILPIMLGTAVKASEYLVDHDKRYIAGIKLGLSTDTQDTTGNVIARYEGELPGIEELREAAKEFTGVIMQTPPMYSALKVGGVKLLELAREGITVERKAREVNIYSCDVFEEGGEFFLDVRCSRGTYIRTLCSDIGDRLGCGAAMCSLRRTEVGGFTLEDSIEFDSLNGMTKDGILDRAIPVEKMFLHLPEAKLQPFFDRLYANGEKILLKKLRKIQGEDGDLFRVCNDARGFYSLGEIIEKDGNKYFHLKKLF
ncbi:MAG: tRNA pseudouridine(55) synthase TruB [Clostridia bacterium]|nr:tRNA pseudouridine(55) synthase TruB [Clostridia bacterium]